MVSELHGRARSLQEERHEKIQRINSLHHEILAPTEAFTVHTEWLESHFNSRESAEQLDLKLIRRKFMDMRENSQLMDVLVTTIGQYENVQLDLNKISLAQLSKTCRGFLMSEARRQGVDVDIQYLGLPRIWGDPSHLMRVLYNMLRNAMKYRDSKEKRRRISVSARQDAHSVFLQVEDNGIGVPTGEEDLIFEKFGRGSNAATAFPEGTGLGLHYCKAILEAHGGKIRLENRAKPTIFELKLPSLIDPDAPYA